MLIFVIFDLDLSCGVIVVSPVIGVHLFVVFSLLAGIQPTLDPSAETI